MSPTLLTRWRRMLAQRSRRGQDGYILTLVLGAIALTSVVIIALLGLAMTTAHITGEQAQNARETRAADSAVEAAAATLARSTATNLCDEVPAGTSVATDNGSADGADDVDVTVLCDPAAAVGGNPDDYLGDPGVEIAGPLAYDGSAPLAFDADVKVQDGASLTGSASPGLTATGQYEQGLAGSTDLCGPTATRIKDRNSNPECGKSGLTFTHSAPQLLGDTATQPPSLPACGSGPTVTFLPGRYDFGQTRQVNALLASCTGKTFWFSPGLYSFDANDPLNADVDQRSALVLNNPGARFVFGAPAGWSESTGAPASSFPGACDRSAPGTSIQLSGRTALIHKAGLVAMCPAMQSGVTLPAITQIRTAPSDPIASDPAATGFSPVSALVAAPSDLSQAATANFGCGAPTWQDGPWSGYCYPQNSFSVRFTNVGTAPLTSARVLVASREQPPAHTYERHVMLSVARADGGPGCSTDWVPSGRTHWQTTSFDLLQGGCASLADQSASVLEGARVTVSYRATLGCGLSDPFFGYWICGNPLEPFRVQARGVRLQLNRVTTSATGTITGAKWSNLGNARVDDGAFANPAQDDCFAGIEIDGLPCVIDAPGTHSVTLGGLQVDGAGLPAGAELSSLYVRVRNTAAGSLNRSTVADPVDGATTTFELNGPGGSCSVSYEGYSHSAQETDYDLLASGNCAGYANADNLASATLTVTFRTGCGWNNGYRYDLDGSGRCPMVRLPDLQYVGLVATSKTQATSPASLVTVNAGAGTDFHVFGSTTLVNSSLQIRWSGDATDKPLFSGRLAVRGLSSTMDSGASMGIVCCDQGAGTVILRGEVDGTVRAEAALAFSDPPAAGGPRTVQILDWRLCGEGGCGTRGVSVLPATTVSVPP